MRKSKVFKPRARRCVTCSKGKSVDQNSKIDCTQFNWLIDLSLARKQSVCNLDVITEND